MTVGEGDYTDIISGQEVKDKLAEGAQAIKTAAGTTFGPYGNNVAICNFYGYPHVTKDGVTAVKDLKMQDPVKDVALQIIKSAAQQTNRKAGDGTTSTTILAANIVENGINSLQGIPIRKIQDTFSEISKGVENHICSVSKAIKTEGDIYNVAFVASNGDTKITDLVTKAFKNQNTNKVIVRPSDSGETTIRVVEGIRIDASSLLQLEEKRTLEHPSILVTNLDINGSIGAGLILKLYADNGETPLFIACNDIDAEAAQILNYARSKGASIDVMRPSHVADARVEYLRLLAVATNSTYVDGGQTFTLQEISPALLGRASSVTVDYQEINIIGREGDVEKEVDLLKKKIEGNKDGLGELYKSYLGILEGESAVLEVGGNNQIEISESSDRIDDTVRAVEGAIKEGVVNGSLTAYEIEGSYNPIITDVIKRSLEQMKDQLLKGNDGEEIWEESILDPALVTKEVFKNALSAASLILTTECVIVKRKENDIN